MALEKTHPTFQVRIARLAALADKPAADIYAAWKTYAAACDGWDQSPLLWEFVQCQEKTFGWDKSEAIKAVL